MTDEERDQWAADVLERIRRHRRREASGLFAMFDDGLTDCLDALAVAPLLLAERMGCQEFETPRQAWLDNYQPDWRKIRQEMAEEKREAQKRARIAPTAEPLS